MQNELPPAAAFPTELPKVMRPFFENTAAPPDREIVLYGADRRNPVEDTSKVPYCWICSIEVEFDEPVVNPLGILEAPGKRWQDLPSGTKGCGSGLLISERHVLTCSHVLMGLKRYRSATSGKVSLVPVMPSKVTVIPARNEAKAFGGKPFGSWKGDAVRVNPQFKAITTGPIEAVTKQRLRSALPHDFALVEVGQRYDAKQMKRIYPGGKTGWWQESQQSFIRAVEGDFRHRLNSRKVNIGGYPGEKGHIQCGFPYHSFDDVATAFPKDGGKGQDLLLYYADTSAGMSGSPVWIKNADGKRFLVAVHSSFQDFDDAKTGRSGNANLGVLVTGGMLGQLRRWGVGG